MSKAWGEHLVQVDSSTEGVLLLASGKHDGLLLGKLNGMQTLQSKAITNVEALKVRAGFSHKFAFAVSNGQSE
jgi:hypothetical protein